MADVYTRIGYIKGATGATGAHGAKGDTGDAATIQVGSVTTVPYGQTANVVNSGTEQAAVFDFTIPQGRPGQQTTEMDNLLLNSITTSAAEFPIPAVGETGKVLWGKVVKWFSDMAALVATKLNVANVVNNLTTTASGYALDARQGKALGDRVITLEHRGAFITRTSVTATQTTITLPTGIKFSDSKVLSILMQVNNTVRGSLVIPVSKFSDGQDCYVVGMVGTTTVTVYIRYISDTSFIVSAADTRINYISIYEV